MTTRVNKSFDHYARLSLLVAVGAAYLSIIIASLIF